MISPCKKQCKLHNDMCVACTRTLQEIKEWNGMADDARMKIMNQLLAVVSTHKCPSCNAPAYCAMEAGKSASTCWCMSVQTNRPMSSGDECLCRTCLTKE